MGFRMYEHENGLTGLAAFCDVCGGRITEHGFVVWDCHDPSDWLVVHQARCDPGRPAGYDCSMALDVELVHLANSAGINLDEARRTTAALAAIG